MNPSDLFLLACLALAAAAGLAFRALWRARRGRTAALGALIAGNLLLFVAIAAAALAAGEAYYRFVHDETDAYQIGLTSQRWMARHYRHNNFGVRDDLDYAIEPRPAARRITFLGDSFTNGHGVARVGQRFVNRLRATHPEWEVHSFAEDGLDTGPILDRLRALLARGYVLDVVVYVACPNDVSDLIPEWTAAAARLYEERPGLLVRSSYLINTWYYRLRVGRDSELARYFDWIAAGYAGTAWDEQARRLRELRRLVEGAGGRLAAVGFPFLELREDPRFTEAARTVDALWDAEGVPHLDLGAAFAGIPTDELVVNRYDSHPNARAHALAAEAIGGFLESILDDAGAAEPLARAR